MEFYVETKSIVQTHRQYQCHFAVRKTPDRKTIWRILKKFQTDRTIYNVNKERSRQTRGARTSETIDSVRLSAVQSPKKSCQRRWIDIVRKLKLDVKFFPGSQPS